MSEILTQKLPLISGKALKLAKLKEYVPRVYVTPSRVFWFFIFLLDVGAAYLLINFEKIILFLNWIDPK